MKRRQNSIGDMDSKLENQIDDIMAKPESIFITVNDEDDDDDQGMVITEHEMTPHHDDLGDIVHTEQITMGEHELQDVEEYDLNPAPSFQNIVIQHMDIAEPLTVLRRLLESKLQCSLRHHEFYLQDQILLDPNRNLVEQCVQGEGMVQINAEIKSQPGSKPKINIVDILKQTEEIIGSSAQTVPVSEMFHQSPDSEFVFHTCEEGLVLTDLTSASGQAKVSQQSDDAENVTRWIVDQNFRKEQDRLKIPYDPIYWNESHVMHWIEWAMNEFQLENVDLAAFSEMTGEELVDLRHEQFQKYIPNDKGDLFWTHLELLRKCRFVAVVQQPTPQAVTTVTVSTSNSNVHGGTYDLEMPTLEMPTPITKGFVGKPWKPKKMASTSRILGVADDRAMPGNRSGNNGQIQLWQFLLELLTDKSCREFIFWHGDEGEFKLNHPEMVAQLWGQRKNKPSMTYEKLSRALRYYYDGDMIAKVHNQRFTYKFVCDLKMLLGYSAAELNRLTTDCADNKQLKHGHETYRPNALLTQNI